MLKLLIILGVIVTAFAASFHLKHDVSDNFDCISGNKMTVAIE